MKQNQDKVADSNSTRPRRKLPWLLATGGAVLWIVAGLSATRLHQAEKERGLMFTRSGGEALASALGGFRGLAADFLWLRAFQMQEQGQYDETALLCRLILDLQPRFTSVWSFLAWNQTYNLSFEANTPEERWRWIRSGFDLLENEGIKRIPNSYVLYWDLGYMHYFRVSHKGHDPMYRHYQEKLSPVPSWCNSEYKFVDEGLWSDSGIRYRLYGRSVSPGTIRLGPAADDPDRPYRARRMYVVAVTPQDAVSRAMAGDVEIKPVPLVNGARLYTDAPDRVAAAGKYSVPRTSAEDAIPSPLSSAALLPLADAQKTLDKGHPVTLEIRSPATVWVCWYPDESRSFHIARKWLQKAEQQPDAPRMLVGRVRVHALVETGEWESAYQEFLELVRTAPPGDDSASVTFKNFLLVSILDRSHAGDTESVRMWYSRLMSEFPGWGKTLEETIDWVTREWGP